MTTPCLSTKKKEEELLVCPPRSHLCTCVLMTLLMRVQQWTELTLVAGEQLTVCLSAWCYMNSRKTKDKRATGRERTGQGQEWPETGFRPPDITRKLPPHNELSQTDSSNL